uniref:uncharacterized protein LOC117604812 n=1 Tax=Osmia lignaria TaxID=473952 RepID=UPI001478981C|nr:uncharacterized protein LOC117604812 [Osmia lignaria]
MQKPFYVEEPSWIEIDKDYGESQPLHRLKTTDPYVISRGKRIDGVVDHLKEELLRKSQNFDVFIRNRFVDKKNKRFSDLKLKNENYDKDNDDDENYEDGEEQKRQRAGKNTSQEIRIRPKKFHSTNADHFVEHFFDPFCIIAVNKGMHKTNRCLPIIKPVPALIDLLRTSGQNFHSSDKMDDHRFEDDSALFERPKSKRFDSNLYSNFDLAVKEILERLIEILECDSTQCRDHFGRAIKRTKLGDGRGMLEDLLNKSDPFYVARGKRVPSPVNESMNAIYGNDRNL